MRNTFLILNLFLFSFSFSQQLNLNKSPYSEKKYGITIQDDYRFIENLQDTIVQNWFKTNGNYTNEVLSSITGKEKLISQLKEFNNRKAININLLCYSLNGTAFYLKKSEKEKKSKLYHKIATNDKEVLLFDPDTYSVKEDYTIAYAIPSWDEHYIAINLVKKGEEIGDIIIFDIQKK
ncbi:hypothetical protein FLACOL_01950 [Flavobacterium columnare]|uniref:Peptidase S9A N-terminal domain-containing protein n=2 Tax=Flavobacterium TaxID=237 RepID=A0ABW8PND5_9FLAO|nr:hypothetical protein [Flavobacterium columnare]SPE77936.1 hypothetical protein FLACOL_01950 [Flavobacterium columnare]